MAQILTRGSLPSLKTLDASDLVECYRVTRVAKLQSIEKRKRTLDDHSLIRNDDPNASHGHEHESASETSSQSGGSHTNTSSHEPTPKVSNSNVITIRKSAIAFRYRSRTSSSSDTSSSSRYSSVKAPFELTLEYGPTRTGFDMDSEAMPRIRINVDETDGSEKKYVSWENEGKIYYEMFVSSDRWDSADYIAPITGAVLEKVLDYAIEYPTFHLRYQPFEVYDRAGDSVVIRSSSSEDFVWDMFDALAQMHVDIRPILIPLRRKVRLYVDGREAVQKVRIGGAAYDASLTQEYGKIIQFMENIESCALGILHDDYKIFIENNMDGPLDEIDESMNIINDLAITGDDKPYNGTGSGTTTGGQKIIVNDEDDLKSNLSTSSEILNFTGNKADANMKNSTGLIYYNQTLAVDDNSLYVNPNASNATQHVNTNDPRNLAENHVTTNLSPILKKNVTDSPTLAPINFTYFSENKAAIQATAIANSQTAKQNLLSGDGSLIVEALQPCFVLDPMNEGYSPAYLYVDGSSYYKLNLSSPYWDVVSVRAVMPEYKKASRGKGDSEDLIIAFLFLIGMMFGVYKLLQKTGLMNVSLWSYLREELSPEGKQDDFDYPFHNAKKENTIIVGGGSPQHFLPTQESENEFAKSSSFSMNSDRMKSAAGGNDGIAATEIETDDDFDEMEMNKTNIIEMTDIVKSRSTGRRDPSHVELPNLMSRTKVAVPVSMSEPDGSNEIDNNIACRRRNNVQSNILITCS